MREIIITFDGADVTIETKGFKGAECQKATAELEKALGGRRTSETLTAEYAKVATDAKTKQ